MMKQFFQMNKRSWNAFLLIAALVLCFGFTLPQVWAQESREILQLGRGTANALDWRPDGKVLAVGGSAGLWFFDTDFQQINHLPTNAVKALQWSPDSTRLLVITNDEHAEIWEIDENLNATRSLLTINDLGRFFRWSPDGTQIANAVGTWSDEKAQGQLIIRNAASGQMELTIPNLYYLVPLAWNPKGSLIAAAVTDKQAAIWDAATGQQVQTFTLSDQYSTIGAITFSQDGETLYITSAEASQLYIVNIETGDFTKIKVGNDNGFLYAPVLPHTTSNLLAMMSRGYNGGNDEIYIYGDDLASQPRFGLWDWIATFSWMPNTNNLTILTGNGMIYNWDVVQDKTTEYQYFISTMELLWSPDGRFLAQASGTYGFDLSYPVMIWDVGSAESSLIYEPLTVIYPFVSLRWLAWKDTEHLITFSDNAALPTAMCLTFSVEEWIARTGERGEWGYEDGMCGINEAPASVFDYIAEWKKDFSEVAYKQGDNTVFIAPDTPYSESRISFTTRGEIDSIIWSPDESRILTVSVDEASEVTFIELWDASSGDRLLFIEVDGINSSVSWNPNGSSIGIVTSDAENKQALLQVIDTNSGELIFERKTRELSEINWSGDGSKIAFTDPVGETITVRVLNNHNGTELWSSTLEAHIKFQWHPTQDILAIFTDGNMSFYDIRTGDVFKTVKTEAVASFVWSPDGSMLALGMDDGTIRIWDVSDLSEN